MPKIIVAALLIALFVLGVLSAHAAVEPAFFLPAVLYSPDVPSVPPTRPPRSTPTPPPPTRNDGPPTFTPTLETDG